MILLKYRGQFKRHYDEWSCNALDVAEAIERSVGSDSDFHRTTPINIDEIILETKFNLEDITEDIESESENKDAYLRYSLELKQELEDKIKRLESIKDRGLTTVLVIGFGDNHGAVQGGNVGYAMDYDGRYIDIDSGDLVVFMEQNR